jgi:AcrR family transcriptional regulator
LSYRRRLTRRESQERTRQQLLDMAVEVFAEKGFARASVEEIAERAGYSKGAVYSNFASKEQLGLTVLDRRIDGQLRVLAELIPAQGGDPRFWADQAESGSKGPWDPLLMELWVRALYDDELRRRLASQQRRVREGAAAILSGGASPSDQHRDAVTLTVALATGLSLQYSVDPDPHLMQLFAQTAARLYNELGPAQPNDATGRQPDG